MTIKCCIIYCTSQSETHRCVCPMCIFWSIYTVFTKLIIMLNVTLSVKNYQRLLNKWNYTVKIMAPQGYVMGQLFTHTTEFQLWQWTVFYWRQSNCIVTKSTLIIISRPMFLCCHLVNENKLTHNMHLSAWSEVVCGSNSVGDWL